MNAIKEFYMLRPIFVIGIAIIVWFSTFTVFSVLQDQSDGRRYSVDDRIYPTVQEADAGDDRRVDAPPYLIVLNDRDPWNGIHRRVLAETEIHKEIRRSRDRDSYLCLALNIYHEARGSVVADRLALSNVVYNRVVDPRWPSTPCEVIWQNRQFSWTQDGRSDFPSEEPAWQEAQLLAVVVYQGHSVDLTAGANHYHATYVEPYWSNKGRDVQLIGAHKYMKVAF